MKLQGNRISTSFGCVELPFYKARELYEKLQDGLATEVIVAAQRLYSSAVTRVRPGLGPAGRFVGSEGQNPPYRGDVAVAA